MTGPLPDKASFSIPADLTYLNSAFIHPMPLGASAAARHYLDQRGLREPRQSGDAVAEQIKAAFARLINARPAEIALVPNTSTGENLVLRGVGLPDHEHNVVTDTLHFEGSMVMLGELLNKGLDVRMVAARDWRIHLEDIEHALDRKTRLVMLSLVSWYNGFQHDLKAVCDLAHRKGAYVYADLVQAAGNTPIDVRATGLDFGACSSFKWLMGDFGLGFLYVKEELLDRVIRRTQTGYQQAETAMHYLPEEAPADWPVTWSMRPDGTGHFEVGSFAQSAAHCLNFSLPYLESLGVKQIEAHRQPLLARLHAEMPRLGFAPITPADCTSALIAFHRKDAERDYAERLSKANVQVSLAGHRMRVSPSVFNDMADVERLLDVLKT